jgi:fibro-slime domain-containing protein
VAFVAASLGLVAGCDGSLELVRKGEGGAGGVGATSSSSSGEGGTGLVIVGSGGAGGQGGGGGGGEGGGEEGGCGDGLIQPGEVCDDANNLALDGCAPDCLTVEQDYACPIPGQACISTVLCGDGVITGLESCDDGNTDMADGCDDACQLELGWVCPVQNAPCLAAQCGDGIVAGKEQCDDGNANPNDGCDSLCKLEPGFFCPTPNQTCQPTVCGNGVKEGDEPCDDGNDIVGDGCGPFCEVEPNCSLGACISACGDGLILPGDNEDCDDGNTLDGDGCSSSCVFEPGFTCQQVVGSLPDVLEVPVTYRDFIGIPVMGFTKHPDFQAFTGTLQTPGLVATMLGADGKPVYTGICEASLLGPCPYGQQTTSQAAFDQWYRDVPGVNIKYVTKLALQQQPNGSYFYPQAAFFPLNGLGWVALGHEQSSTANNGSLNNNFNFTTEIRTWFQFNGGESLQFSGDDDVWVFINRRRALDLGGLHPQVSGSFTLDAPTATALDLQQGRVNLTLSGFVTAKSVCETDCGDGIVAGDEVCDDGVNDGSYGGCTHECLYGPYCGDGVGQSPEEECDDGVNLAVYAFGGQPACAPGCKFGAYCGDAQVQSLWGESCDLGTANNTGAYGGCNANCTLAPRCGDGVVQPSFGEQCDDGNLVSGDGCSSSCKQEVPQ